jgi:hypothetical protein
MYQQVPEFHAWKCQGSGTSASRKPRKAKLEKSG